MRRIALLLLAASFAASLRAAGPQLSDGDAREYIARFNAADNEDIATTIPNSVAADWIIAQAPLFDCPKAIFEEIYYYRWWTFRKHVKETPLGRVITEFIAPVSHAGPHNTIACAVGHHLVEGRWLRDRALLDEYATFWLRSGPNGGPAPHFHKFSGWFAAALYQRALATGDFSLPLELLDELVADYRLWEAERLTPAGLFWQYDVRDGMEESISGSRTEQNLRPTINSYMAANAAAIAEFAERASRPELAAEFSAKSNDLRSRFHRTLWDEQAQFFKVRRANGQFSDAREAIGFIPWMFNLAEPRHAVAWRQLRDPAGFWAPRGLTTAERRHPQFRTHGVGTCEWDGAVWPFATSQTLTGLANLLRGPEQEFVTREEYFETLKTYANAHTRDGATYLGEYHDETTGEWLIPEPKAQRSRYYNHSTFNDLVITGLVGLVPQSDDTVVIDPLLPAGTWDYFCLTDLPYHGRQLTIVWDRTGERYRHGAGLAVWANGSRLGQRSNLGRLEAPLPNTYTN